LGEAARRSISSTAVGQSAGSEDAGSAHHQDAVEVGLGVEFAGEFGDGVGAEGMGGVLLDIGMAGTAIEDVIGGEVDQLGVGLAAGEGQVAHGQRVDQKGGQRLLLGDIDLIIGGGVEDHFGIAVGQGVLHGQRVGDVHLGAIPGHDGEPALPEFTDQLSAQLSGGSEDYRASAHRNTTIANASR
jgi:hypothetical protein